MGISAGQGVPSLRPGVCTSTTRPTNPFEGQMIYETDTDMLALWNGSAWRYIAATTPTNGSVLQVSHSTTSSEVRLTSYSAWASTGVTATITPKSTSNKILVQASLQYRPEDSTGAGVGLRLKRGSTVVYTDGANYGMGYSSNASGSSSRAFFQYLDSPASTSSLTYTIEGILFGAGQVSFQDDSQYSSNITLMELAA